MAILDSGKRRAVNLTIRADILAAAKELKLNTSQAAETGIAAAVKKALEQSWLEHNRDALLAHNQRIEKSGTLLKPDWAQE